MLNNQIPNEDLASQNITPMRDLSPTDPNQMRSKSVDPYKKQQFNTADRNQGSVRHLQGAVSAQSNYLQQSLVPINEKYGV